MSSSHWKLFVDIILQVAVGGDMQGETLLLKNLDLNLELY